MSETNTTDFVHLAAGITASYAAGNHFPASELPNLLTAVHGALRGLAQGSPATAAPAPAINTPSPAEIRKSIRPEGLVSFLDGRSYKALKRHLTAHGLDPARYRARFGLPADYPMTCPSYSAQRSSLAKAIGLGGSIRRVQQAAE